MIQTCDFAVVPSRVKDADVKVPGEVVITLFLTARLSRTHATAITTQSVAPETQATTSGIVELLSCEIVDPTRYKTELTSMLSSTVHNTRFATEEQWVTSIGPSSSG